MVWLRQLHALGLPTAEIARRMNLSKNTVTGKISRLNLNEGHAPIVAANDSRRTSPRTDPNRVVPMRNPRITLPPLPSLSGS